VRSEDLVGSGRAGEPDPSSALQTRLRGAVEHGGIVATGRGGGQRKEAPPEGEDLPIKVAGGQRTRDPARRVGGNLPGWNSEYGHGVIDPIAAAQSIGVQNA
jgi:hypothetical protein